MTHPNDDFIKRFLGEDKVSPEQQKALLKKQRMKNYYKSLEQKNILVEEDKKAIDYTTRKIFSNTKPKTLVDLQEAKKAAAQWIEKLTPYGVFFYNKEQDVWMNNFGVIKKTLDEFLIMFNYLNSSDASISMPYEPPVYDNSMSLLRFVDSDIYGFIIEKNENNTSIDNFYPTYPYTSDTTLTNFGNIYEFLNVMNNMSSWDAGLANKVFLGGAAGRNIDIDGATTYGEPGSNERLWSQNWARLGDGAVQSFYDIGDSARRGVGSGTVKRSTLSKYQWFDFKNNTVNGSIRQCIAAGYGGSTIIEQNNKINVPRVGYTSNINKSSAIYSLILSNPSVEEIESINSNLVSTNAQGIKIAQVRELFSNDLNGDSISDVSLNEQVNFVSIDQSVDQVLATLDDKGSIRILLNRDSSAEAVISRGKAWEWLVYFDKEWIGEGFLTDDTGSPVFIENKDFASVTVSNGLGSSLIYVWCLHKNGKLYGAELTSSSTSVNGTYKKLEKFIIPGNPSSGRSTEFGTLTAQVGSDPTGTDKPDEYRQYYTWTNNLVSGNVINGVCKEIAYVLNFIPKINGFRFPVLSVYGGYHNGGILTCVDPTYTGYLPSSEDNFNHPVQMCEIVQLQKVNTMTTSTLRLLSKIQRYKALYDSNTNSWSYTNNSDLDQNMYDNIFGITINVNGTNELVYVPPRCVSVQRIGANNPQSSPTTQADGIIHILTNNGNWIPIAGSDTYVPCKFNNITNPNYSQEISQYNRLTMQGSFTLNYQEWGYTAWGPSSIFNQNCGNFQTARWKFGSGPSTPFTSPALVSPQPTVETFDANTMWPSFFSQASPLSHGFGNPPRINNILMEQYNIPVEGENLDNLYGFSMHDYFGNTFDEGRAPAYAQVQNNYINDNLINKVRCYPDIAGNYPIFLNGTINPGYTFYANVIPILAIADDTKLNNPFAWLRGVGDITYGIRFDGTVDLISHRGADNDGFLFDPFWGPVYPEGRLNPSLGITFSNLKPANYDDLIESMKKVGSYIEGTYQQYNYYLPNV